ncbi:histidine triad nucleotide-binding protein [Agromyces aerolatus]|uniref:histidine triad nucleotide-binding protein n=1 Tax=Agromyces sp. LY-1074 TaxID=3074080 RepID=UPI00285C4395|nr:MULTISPECIES: histidine triad nucleotide-binding protein [unclassified Agromyces]MDR5700244.1 histidine triad nucleotide-binding protein [Agromyces sp. LY-1074]MDR5706388.1 histidine triad nucleotide-binding protein [Agromyces sp. LY-1358]
MTETREPTVFERIAAREIPARIVTETDRVIAFHDIAPKAPVHVVVTPKTAEYRDVVELAAGDPALLAEVIDVARGVAAELGDGDFRLVFNTGANSGQTVFHVHAHVLAGGLEEGSLAGL